MLYLRINPIFLEQTICSVLNQTYKNIELIIVNDLSPYNIDGIVDKFQDSRIRYYINEKNLGKDDPGVNWNKCLDLAKGDFFCLLCDDDLYEPTMVETLMSLAVKYPNVGVFRSRVKIVDSLGNLIDFYPSSPEYETGTNYMIDMGKGCRKQTISEFMYRTDFIRKQGGYSLLPKAMCSDHLTIYRLGLIGGIVSTTKPLVCFRLSDVNLSGHGLDHDNIIEKLLANNLFLEEVRALTSNMDAEIAFFICDKHVKKFARANAIVISCARMKDFMYILIHYKKLGITMNLLRKGIFLKLKNLVA